MTFSSLDFWVNKMLLLRVRVVRVITTFQLIVLFSCFFLMNLHSFFGRNTNRRFLVYSLLPDIAPAGSRFVSSQNYDIQQVNQSVTVVLASLALSPTPLLTSPLAVRTQGAV